MKSREELIKTVIQGLKPIPSVRVSEWASEYRIISAGGNPAPGRWNNKRSPFLVPIMDAFTEPNVKQVVFKSASQVGKSECLNNIIGRYIMLDPCSIMLVQPSLEMAQDYSKRRIAPMLRDCSQLRKLIYEDKESSKTRTSNQTILSKNFTNGATLVLAGSNSPAGLASRPIRILLCDEIDRYPISAGSEGDPIEIASKRTTTFWNAKIGLFSTPTIKGESRIELAYSLGTREVWRHECPMCKNYNVLEYGQMQIEYDVKTDQTGRKFYYVRDVKYKCPECGEEFTEIEMKSSKQEYIAENIDALKNGIRSFFVNGFSSPWIDWGTICREYLESQGNPDLEQVVVNTRFGESYIPTGEIKSEKEIETRCERYETEVPSDVLILTAAVDVQDNRLEYEICGWGMYEESWGIKKGTIFGSPGNVSTWDALDQELDREYESTEGKRLKVSRTFIDSGGHFTGNVYDYCRLNVLKGRYAIKGRGGSGIPLIDGVSRLKNGTILVIIGVNEGKTELYNRLKIENPGPKYFHFPQDDSLLRGYDNNYFRGLISERKVNHIIGGKLVSIYEPINKRVRNEPLDLRVYNIAALASCQIKDWVEFRQQQAIKQTTSQNRQTNRSIKSRSINL